MQTDRRTDRQTDRQTDEQTYSLQYFTTLTGQSNKLKNMVKN